MPIIDGTEQRIFAIRDAVRIKEQYLNEMPDEKNRFNCRVGKFAVIAWVRRIEGT